jgi:hypothetical protein
MTMIQRDARIDTRAHDTRARAMCDVCHTYYELSYVRACVDTHAQLCSHARDARVCRACLRDVRVASRYVAS